MDPSESCDVPRAIFANTLTDHIAGKATLEGMPTEIHWQILRNFLKPPETIELFPQDTYTNRSWVFGSLGILRVSKYFSAIGLSILYGENHFSFQNHERDLEDFDDSDDDDDEDGPVSSSLIVFPSLLEG